MSVSTTDMRTQPGTRYGNPVCDCCGARLRAQSRRLATVVTVSGEIRGDNVALLTEHARRILLASTSVVLDLSGVTVMDPQGVALLNAIDQDCSDIGRDWVLVPSSAVLEVLETSEYVYPDALSVPDALTHFEDETLRRRSLLLPLLTKSA
jgi:anti-anti-sigma factor